MVQQLHPDFAAGQQRTSDLRRSAFSATSTSCSRSIPNSRPPNGFRRTIWRKLSLHIIACEIRILILEQLTTIADLQHTILTCRSRRFAYTEAKELIQLSVRVGQFQQRLSRRDISEACFQTTVHWLQLELTELGQSHGLIGLLKEAVRKQLEGKHNELCYVSCQLFRDWKT